MLNARENLRLRILAEAFELHRSPPSTGPCRCPLQCVAHGSTKLLVELCLAHRLEHLGVQQRPHAASRLLDLRDSAAHWKTYLKAASRWSRLDERAGMPQACPTASRLLRLCDTAARRKTYQCAASRLSLDERAQVQQACPTPVEWRAVWSTRRHWQPRAPLLDDSAG
jgi:hypothetical protein